MRRTLSHVSDESSCHRLRVAVVGAGLIGQRRARVAQSHPRSELTLIVDKEAGKARALALDLGCESATDWAKEVRRNDIDVVVVATPNDLLAPVSIAAINAGKHVLCEKPMAVCAGDAERMVAAARRRGVALKVGYTLRHHPAIGAAHRAFSSGEIGKLMYVRCCYGHGGRPGYDREWRFARTVSGGGELIDQGVHVIDLARWFLGEIKEVFAAAAAFFWPVSPLEDNVFALLRTTAGHVVQFHASCTQWRNRFALELFGTEGYLIVDGLGGSYGGERLIVGIRNAQHGPPREKVRRFADSGLPWRNEWKSFMDALRSHPSPIADGEDGLRALRVAHALYKSARTKRMIPL